MLHDELAASKLNLHSSNEPVTVAEGWGGWEHVSRVYKGTINIQLSMRHLPTHHLYLVCIFLVVRLIKKGHCYLTEKNLHSNWKTKGLDTDPIQRMRKLHNTGHHWTDGWHKMVCCFTHKVIFF